VTVNTWLVGSREASAAGRFVIGRERSASEAGERHRFDGTFRCLELRSVKKTAATWRVWELREVDATSTSSSLAKLPSVCRSMPDVRTV